MKSTLPGTERSSWFANLRLGVKLTLALGLLFFFMLALGLTALWTMRGARQGSAHLVSDRLPQLEASETVERDTYEAMLNFTAYALSGDEAEYSGGRQSLARIKEAVARLRVLSLNALADPGDNAFAVLVDGLHSEINRFDALAEDTRTLIHNKERSWAAFNASLIEVDRTFVPLRALHAADFERFKELADLQGDFHALRAAISTALTSESGMTLHSLSTDFSRISARLLVFWQERPKPLAQNAADRPGSARNRQAEAAPDSLEEDELHLLQTISQGRTAISALTDDLETARGLARDRRETAAKIALLARDMSRDAMDELRSAMDGGLGFLTSMIVVFIALLFLAACGCFFVFLAFSKGIINPLAEIALFAKEAAGGEATSTLSFSSDDELGDLAHSLRALAGAQREAVSRMQHREREAERLMAKAADALYAVKKREQEIVALVNAIRERDRSTSSAGAVLPEPTGPQTGLAATTQPAAQTPQKPETFVPAVSAVAPALATPSSRNSGKATQESEAALRDLVEMSADMRRLIRQLADK